MNARTYDRQGSSPAETEANEKMARAMRRERVRVELAAARETARETRAAHRRHPGATKAEHVHAAEARVAALAAKLAEVAS